MKLKDLRTKENNDLGKLLAKTREELREVRFKVSQRQHKNYRELRSLKKDIARILTVVKEKELLSNLRQEENK